MILLNRQTDECRDTPVFETNVRYALARDYFLYSRAINVISKCNIVLQP